MKNKIINLSIFILAFIILIGPALATTCMANGEKIPCDVFWAGYGWMFVVIFLPVGLVFMIKPEWPLKWEIWQQKVFMGAKFIPSKRTILITRILGAIFAISGLLALCLALFY